MEGHLKYCLTYINYNYSDEYINLMINFFKDIEKVYNNFEFDTNGDNLELFLRVKEDEYTNSSDEYEYCYDFVSLSNRLLNNKYKGLNIDIKISSYRQNPNIISVADLYLYR